MDAEGDEQRTLHEATKRVSLRSSHPNLFRSLLTIAITQVALGVNFYVRAPTFNPYGISRFVVGAAFFVLGASQIVVLTVYRRLQLVRLLAAISVAVMVCWGIINTRQAFDGKASYQVPILMVGLGALQVPLLIEPRINPITANDKQPNGTP